ncbi:Mu transposase C-terminal domain-containing protein [Cupriavidus metallidurans]|uniref:Mu transposase C-terminal domain-containing protein n=1 Tax=Cupriavidus metallidurans TaxID=119219 RepID=UPI0005697CCC|nr:Mu transposase C-terminal domain-containing protein [Cupriavidus metallidurans]
MKIADQLAGSKKGARAAGASRAQDKADTVAITSDGRVRIFQRGGKTYQVCVALDARTVVCRDLQDGKLVEFSTGEIGLESVPIAPGATGQLRDAPDSVRKETARRRHYLREVAKHGATSFRRGDRLREAIGKAAQRLGDPQPPSDSTVVRWWHALLRDGFAGLMSHTDLRGGKGKPRLAAGHIEKISGAVEQCLQRPRRPIVEILDEVNQRVAAENAWKLGLPDRPITRATLYRFLRKQPAIERLRAKVGTAEAHRMLSLSKADPSEGPSRPLQRVQSDHGQLDVMLVDEVTGEPVGRPYLSVMVCVATRMVVAWEVSLASPNEQTVLALLRQAMTGISGGAQEQKLINNGAGGTDRQTDSPNAPSRRLAHGQIEMLLFDRAKEFDSAAVQAACSDLDIVAMFCPAYRPDSKGHVERFIGTVNRSFISSLPGTTYGSPKERRGYDAQGNATLTISELRTVLGRWIDTVYALTPHDGLKGATPGNAWQQFAASHCLDSLHSDEAVSRACRPRERRHIGKSGIKLFGNQRYASAELEALRCHFGLHCEVTVRFDPLDLGRVWVIHPETRLELAVPNVDPTYARELTLREHELLRKCQRASNHHAKNAAQLSSNREAVRREVEKAQADRTMRRRKAAAIARDAGRRARPSPPTSEGTSVQDGVPAVLGVFRVRPRKDLPGFVLGGKTRLGVAIPLTNADPSNGASHEE